MLFKSFFLRQFLSLLIRSCDFYSYLSLCAVLHLFVLSIETYINDINQLVHGIQTFLETVIPQAIGFSFITEIRRTRYVFPFGRLGLIFNKEAVSYRKKLVCHYCISRKCFHGKRLVLEYLRTAQKHTGDILYLAHLFSCSCFVCLGTRTFV